MNYTIDQLKDALVRADAAGDTESAQILADELASRQADLYVKAEPENDMWTGFKLGAAELAHNVEQEAPKFLPGLQWVRKAEDAIIPGFEALSKRIAQGGDGMERPTTIAGTLAEAAPTMLASVPGWEIGAEAALSRLTTEATPAVLKWAAKGLGGTLGSDITSGEEITPENLSAGTGANILMESIFHTPDALKLMKVMLAKNGEAIQEAADHIGVIPSMGITTTRNWVRSLENAVSKLPGGNLVNTQNAKSLATMASFVEGVKSKLGFVGDASALGREIKRAVESAEKDFDKESEELYDGVMKKAGRSQMTNTRRFVRKVEELYGVNPKPGVAEMTAPPIVRKYMAYIDAAGKNPTNTGYSNLPVNLGDARKMLKLLDDYIGTGESANADSAAAKQMASALRRDIGGTFEALGLGGEWRSIQDRYAAGISLLNQARGVMGRADTGDAVYTRLFGNESGVFSPKGVDTLTPLKKVMSKDEWDHLAAEVVHRMGLESAGTATAEGRQFNPSTFLTNWNRLNPAAKEMLFDADHSYDLEQLAKLSEGFKERAKDANHSGTAHSLVNMHALSSVGAALTGHPAVAAGLVSAAVVNNLTARLLINPKAARLMVDAAYATEPNQVQQWIIKVAALVAAHPELSQDFANLGDENK